MSLDTINTSALKNVANLSKDNPDKKLNPFAATTATLSNLNLKDNIITDKLKKLTEPGNNPFGSNNQLQDRQVKGVIAKNYPALARKIETNQDGFLSHRELVDAMGNKNIKAQDAALVDALLQNEGKIRNLNNDESTIEIKGITEKDIQAFDQLPDTNELKSNVESEFYYASGNISSIHAKYSKTFDSNDKLILPTKASDVDYKDLQQGGAGDCYFLAALASLAQHQPQKIVDMIKDNKNGTYTVKFAEKSVTINAPTDSELGLYAQGKAWVPIIEKAYGVYRNETDLISKVNPYDKSGGGSLITGRGMKDLTGASFDTDFLKTANYNTTRQKLKIATENNKMMTASISNSIIGQKNSLGLPQGHVYTIIGYDEKTDKVKIRNPWGNTEAQDANGSPRDGVDDGIFELSMQEFHKNFNFAAYEK